MNCKISVFEYLGQKIMFLPDVNYFFGIKNDYDLELGDYELSTKEILAIAKENDPDEYEVFIKTSFEERLNKIRAYDIKEIKEESSYGQYTLCLHPSRKCNLNCKYCFKESEYLGNEQLSFKVAKDAIDFLVDKYAPCASKYVVDLSGSGEPLLQIKLIKQIVDYCKKKRNEVCKNIEVMFCTNLTLLTPEIVDYLDNEPTIILGTSIDGDQLTNDNNRVYANGKGTYDDILKGLKLFKNKKLGFAVTITPLNQDVDCIYNHLYHLPSVDCISMKFIRNYDVSEYNCKNFDSSYLISRYEKLCGTILMELQNNNLDYLIKLLKGADMFGNYIRDAISKNLVNYHRCDAGNQRIMINNKGEIYACSVMANMYDFYLGNIYNNHLHKSDSSFVTPNIFVSIKCRDCKMRYRCGGECYAVSYLNFGNLFTPSNNICAIKEKLIELSMSLIEKIKAINNNIYNNVIHAFFRIQRFNTTDSGIVSLYNFLKINNKNVSFDDIINKDIISDFGVQPINILKTLKDYFPSISSYKIENEFEFDELQLPSVALVTSATNTSFEYVLIIKLDENKNIHFQTFETKEEKVLPVKSFINKVSNIVFTEKIISRNS